jgi:hypothetical protein
MCQQTLAGATGVAPTLRFLGTRVFLSLAIVLAGTGGYQSLGQALPTAEVRASAGVFADFGGMRTHVEDFTYNALGVNAGLYLQSPRLLGVEVRGGTYPLYARFAQAPVTAGFRLVPHWTLPGYLRVFGYFGGGMSKSQNAGLHYVATPATWSPCWQASTGADIPLGHFKFRLYDATWTETYSPVRNLGSISLSTGLVYIFR